MRISLEKEENVYVREDSMEVTSTQFVETEKNLVIAIMYVFFNLILFLVFIIAIYSIY